MLVGVHVHNEHIHERSFKRMLEHGVCMYNDRSEIPAAGMSTYSAQTGPRDILSKKELRKCDAVIFYWEYIPD